MRYFVSFVFLLCSSFVIGQQTTIQTTSLNKDFNKPFQPTTLFGGGILFGGGSGFFQFGLNPELIKQVNPYIDLGVAANMYYTARNPTIYSNIKSRNTQFGIGAFTRIWPLEQFFVQAQPEYNWTWSTAKDISSGQSGSTQVGAASFLTGIGYGRRNESGFAYVSVLFDLVNDIASPYRMGQSSPQPIIRAGFGFAIKKKKAD